MFSIIIPLYNKGKKVKDSIASVLLQSYTDFEIVVVDDGSTDDSAQYVKVFDDQRIKYYYKDNGGVSSARNYGIKKAHGEWLIFLDADDEMMPGALTVCSSCISKDNQCKIICGQQVNNQKPARSISKSSKRPYFDIWRNRFYPRPGALVIHKSVIERLGAFDERMSFFEDYEFGIRMLEKQSVIYTNNQFVNYVQTEDGLSQKRHPMHSEMAFYIPELLKGNSDFWYKVLLYENLEWMCYWKQDYPEDYRYYRNMQKELFPLYYKPLHWVRQQMIRHGWI